MEGGGGGRQAVGRSHAVAIPSSTSPWRTHLEACEDERRDADLLVRAPLQLVRRRLRHDDAHRDGGEEHARDLGGGEGGG